jgi:tetrahydromethanopterin S-methyltransferase subunit G
MAKRVQRIAAPSEWSIDVVSLDKEILKQKFAECTPEDAQKLAAHIYTVYSADEVAAMASRSRFWVHAAAHRFADIYKSAKLARMEHISELAQRKALGIIESINPEEIAQDKKAKAAKDLVETADIANVTMRLDKVKDTEETTAELIFRIRQRGSGRGRDGNDYKAEKAQQVVELEKSDDGTFSVTPKDD